MGIIYVQIMTASESPRVDGAYITDQGMMFFDHGHWYDSEEDFGGVYFVGPPTFFMREVTIDEAIEIEGRQSVETHQHLYGGMQPESEPQKTMQTKKTRQFRKKYPFKK